MEHLSQRDFRAILEFLRESHRISSSRTFAARTVKGLLKLVPADLAVYCEMNLRTATSLNWEEPRGLLTLEVERSWERVMHEHPMFTNYQRTRDGRAYTISDFLPRARYRRLSLYNEFYRSLGAEEDINFFLASPSAMFIGISLHRGWRRFSERDRLLLNLTRPHLTQAWQNARAFTGIQRRLASLERAFEQVDHGLVVLHPNGRPQLTTLHARQVIRKYFGNSGRPDSHLPETLQRWIKQNQTGNGEREIKRSRAPFIRECDDGRLVVRLLADAEQILLLFEEHKTELNPGRLQHLGLTLREAEVLAWVSKGKTNSEIATILGLSARTVQKHLERVFQKLGVETRTAAAARALEQPHPEPSQKDV